MYEVYSILVNGILEYVAIRDTSDEWPLVSERPTDEWLFAWIPEPEKAKEVDGHIGVYL